MNQSTIESTTPVKTVVVINYDEEVSTDYIQETEEAIDMFHNRIDILKRKEKDAVDALIVANNDLYKANARISKIPSLLRWLLGIKSSY